MSSPIIGLTPSRLDTKYDLPAQGVMQAYMHAVHGAGGIPVILPLDVPVPALTPLLARLDGIIFTGGGDIHPARYGLPLDEYVAHVDGARDRLETDLFAEITRRRMPFLGICRGIQLVNVALGGTLYTDIQAQYPGAHKHDFYPSWPRSYLAHPVRIEKGSALNRILNLEETWVNSLHHQAIRELAAPLRPVAWAPEGFIEGVELPDYPFGLGVQWHPEWLQTHAPMQALFRAFVAAAQGKAE